MYLRRETCIDWILVAGSETVCRDKYKHACKILSLTEVTHEPTYWQMSSASKSKSILK